MGRLRVAAIVEGHGEVQAFPILLRRIWIEFLGGEYIDILTPPIRQPRDKLAKNKNDTLTRALQLAASKLKNSRSDLPDPELILVLIDADDDLPCVLGPEMLAFAESSRGDFVVSCVVANVDFETWFIASATSLSDFLDDVASAPADPEASRVGKGWIKRKFKGPKYSETIDQAKMAARMDLARCRDRSKSFDKLYRELEKQLHVPPS